MKKLLINIPKEVYHDLKAYGHGFDKELDVKGIVSIILGKDLSKMTNGEVIKMMFPNLKVEDNGGSIYLHYPDGGWIVFDRDWWNAPYEQKEVEQ